MLIRFRDDREIKLRSDYPNLIMPELAVCRNQNSSVVSWANTSTSGI